NQCLMNNILFRLKFNRMQMELFKQSDETFAIHSIFRLLKLKNMTHDIGFDLYFREVAIGNCKYFFLLLIDFKKYLMDLKLHFIINLFNLFNINPINPNK